MAVAAAESDEDASRCVFNGVKGTFTLVDGRPITARTEVTAAGLPFVQIPGFHDNTNGSTRGPNTLVRWTQAGLRLALVRPSFSSGRAGIKPR